MAAKKTEYRDFKQKFEELSKAVESSETLKNDPLLKQQLRDFERMAEMNDSLWDAIKEQGYTFVDDKGRVSINPAVGTFNKNVSTLLKTAQWIEEKTAGITLNDKKKSW